MKNRAHRILLTSLIVLVLLVFAEVVRADVTGGIQGTVHDRSQAIVAGAQVVAINGQTNFKQETITGSDGSYRILALSAGTKNGWRFGGGDCGISARH